MAHKGWRHFNSFGDEEQAPEESHRVARHFDEHQLVFHGLPHGHQREQREFVMMINIY